MTDSIKERLKRLAQDKGYSIRSFEETCGLGRGNISNMSQDGSIGSDKLSKIFDTFPDTDLYWLLTGKEQINQSNQSDSSPLVTQLLGTIKEQAEEIGRLKTLVSQLEQRRGDNVGRVQNLDIANVG